MSSMHHMEEKKMQHFRETMDRLTAASHVRVEYFQEHKKIEGYYESIAEGKFFNCDRLMKQENQFGKIQLGYNPNRKRVFLFANMKTSRYDTVASKYQKEMQDYQKKTLLKGDNENRAYISKRWEQATVLIEKKENKPWTQRSIKTYLGRANMEAAVKMLPFFTKEEEKSELKELKSERKAIQENISELLNEMAYSEELSRHDRAVNERAIRSHRAMAVKNFTKENLLEAIITRKNAAEKAFLRRINYAYDFQKYDIEEYYKEKRKGLDSKAEGTGAEEERPEDEER